MNLEEKEELLNGIDQSKEAFQSEHGSSSSNSSKVEISSSNFPPIQTPGKSNVQTNKLKLPRKLPTMPKVAELFDNSIDKSITIVDDDDIKKTQFSFPFCINDDAQPLPKPKRALQQIEDPYYTMEGETPAMAYRRMLSHHDKWKAMYKAEINKTDTKKNVEDLDSVEQKGSPKNDVEVEEEENDPYTFESNSPVQIINTYKGGNHKGNNLYDNGTGTSQNSRTIQRKMSRDSDCEEVEAISKPEDPKLGDWIQTGSRSRHKRNRKQMGNQDKNKSVENNSNVEFDFDNKWESQSSTWQSPAGSSSTWKSSAGSSTLNNQNRGRRSIYNTPVVEEEKVECPLCQQNFAITKVEAHAANCEGYAGAPMDVEEAT